MALDVKQFKELAKEAQTISWAQLWHMPAFLLGLGVFVVGLYVAIPEPPTKDFLGALDTVEHFFATTTHTTNQVA